MWTDDIRHRVEAEYVRLQRLHPASPKLELWTRAKETVSQQAESGVMPELTVRKLPAIGVVGLVLVSIATAMTAGAFVLWIRDSFVGPDYAAVMWLGGSLLGSVGLVLLVTANAVMNRFVGVYSMRGLVSFGFVVAAFGATASALILVLGAAMVSCC